MSVLDILIPSIFNKSDAEKIGIDEGDFNSFYTKLEEYRDDLNNA